jgi:hypothetical protein
MLRVDLNVDCSNALQGFVSIPVHSINTDQKVWRVSLAICIILRSRLGHRSRGSSEERTQGVSAKHFESKLQIIDVTCYHLNFAFKLSLFFKLQLRYVWS